MDIQVIASGSTGNCYHISDGHAGLLIECGIRYKKIQEALEFKVSHVAGCLVSHEHKDHCKAVKDIMKAGVNCYLTRGTVEELKLSGHRLKLIKPLKIAEIDTFKVLPFSTQHDAKEPVGFLLKSSISGEKLLFITDSFYCKYRFSSVNYFMVECNYSRHVLEENIKSGVTPAEVRNRIVRSHFELENVKEFFRVNDLSVAREIHLIHISEGNGDPCRFRSEIQKITGVPVYAYRKAHGQVERS